jgi:hypothetical protein
MTPGQTRYLALVKGGPLPLEAFKPPVNPMEEKLDELIRVITSMQTKDGDLRIRPRTEFAPG